MGRLAVLGCGYVGLELARQLTDSREVVGVRRSAAGIEAIEAAGATGVQADLTDRETLEAVPDAETVVFAASAGGRSPQAARETYVDAQRTAIEAFGERERSPDRYIYTSSTGVYGDHGGNWVDEETPLTPETEREAALLEAEELALDRTAEFGIDGTVARFAGLYGPSRYRLERYLDGPVADGYLNMVHRDDAAGVVAHLLRNGLARQDTVLVVDDEPVWRPAFADWLAAECRVDKPEERTKLAQGDGSTTTDRRRQTDKRCANDKLHELGYEFRYPTFRDGYREPVSAYRTAARE